jgi:hypothetical protein
VVFRVRGISRRGYFVLGKPFLRAPVSGLAFMADLHASRMIVRIFPQIPFPQSISRKSLFSQIIFLQSIPPYPFQ